MVGQPTLLLEQVLDQKERKVGGHRMNHKKAVTMKKDPMKKIFVGGLNPEATEEKIREYFGKFGEVSVSPGCGLCSPAATCGCFFPSFLGWLELSSAGLLPPRLWLSGAFSSMSSL